MGDTYRLDHETVTEKAIVRVYRPILTPEEKAKRIKTVEAALKRYYMRVVASGVDWDEAVREGQEAMKKQQP